MTRERPLVVEGQNYGSEVTERRGELGGQSNLHGDCEGGGWSDVRGSPLISLGTLPGSRSPQIRFVSCDRRCGSATQDFDLTRECAPFAVAAPVSTPVPIGIGMHHWAARPAFRNSVATDDEMRKRVRVPGTPDGDARRSAVPSTVGLKVYLHDLEGSHRADCFTTDSPTTASESSS